MTYPRLDRIDLHVGRIQIVESLDAHEPQPGIVPAERTPEGYLVADGYIARDGLLQYSDGTDTWIEYRPRAELVAAAATWTAAPLTDDHPSKMVDASSWSQVAKGIHMSAPQVTDADVVGVSYLHARLLFTDAALVKKIESGEQDELSIGFTSRVVPTQNGVAEDGTRADAVQTDLLGNHTAAVSTGRAGPACRVLLDSAAQFAYNGDSMPIPIRKPTTKLDEAGAPTDMVEILGPDGQPVSVPTWVAGMLAELQQLKAAAPAAPEAPAAPAPAAPVAAPDAAAAAPAPAPPAPTAASASPDEEEEEDNKDAEEEEKEKEEKDAMSRDAMSLLVRNRARLRSLAQLAGVAAEKLDTVDDETLAREYLAKTMPAVKLDGLDRSQLDTLVMAASATPVDPKNDAAPPAQPWGGFVIPVQHTDAADDPADETASTFLEAQGY